jgi:hypothetical protein
MKRTRVKGVGRQPYSPSAEPDFYTYSSLPETMGRLQPRVSALAPSFASVVSRSPSSGGNRSSSSDMAEKSEDSAPIATHRLVAGGQSSLSQLLPRRVVVSVTSDQMALEAQRILALADLKADSSECFATDLTEYPTLSVSKNRLPTSQALPPSQEADLILGALSAVSPYYNHREARGGMSSFPV